ncbi:MAG TPA: hypothetical protein VMV25_04685 [Steroidobacteraceae bacterium]|nr:hypothetical protein [Steroidobacteraceae bacterium]
MGYRNLLIGALLAAGLGGAAGAETIAVGHAIEVQKPAFATPKRGMTMDQVAQRFGAPVEKLPAVGKPPITRWKYPGYIVYFEFKTVIDSVVAG